MLKLWISGLSGYCGPLAPQLGQRGRSGQPHTLKQPFSPQHWLETVQAVSVTGTWHVLLTSTCQPACWEKPQLSASGYPPFSDHWSAFNAGYLLLAPLNRLSLHIVLKAVAPPVDLKQVNRGDVLDSGNRGHQSQIYTWTIWRNTHNKCTLAVMQKTDFMSSQFVGVIPSATLKPLCNTRQPSGKFFWWTAYL